MRDLFAIMTLVGAVFLAGLNVPVYAEDRAEVHAILISGRHLATVTTPVVRLSDLAEVSSGSEENDEGIIALKSIEVLVSPQPGEEIVLQANQVIEILKSRQVNFEEVGYTFPTTIKVNRVGRSLTMPEAQSAIQEYFSKSDRPVTVGTVTFDEKAKVWPDTIEITAEPTSTSSVGKQNFILKVSANGERSRAVKASAVIEEWRTVPIAARSIDRGGVVVSDDIKMARLDVLRLPGSILGALEEVLGRAVTARVNPGEPFLAQKLNIPPLVNAGQKVTMVFKQNGFEATATGIAMGAGAEGDEVRVRNERSKKIVVGKVSSEGLVVVTTSAN